MAFRDLDSVSVSSFCFQDNDVRIIIGQFDENLASKVFCCVSLVTNTHTLWTWRVLSPSPCLTRHRGVRYTRPWFLLDRGTWSSSTGVDVWHVICLRVVLETADAGGIWYGGIWREVDGSKRLIMVPCSRNAMLRRSREPLRFCVGFYWADQSQPLWLRHLNGRLQFLGGAFVRPLRWM